MATDPIDTGSTWPSAPPAESPYVRQSALQLGDRYEDRGLIGSGGMGQVRRVLDQRLGVDVALKILRWEVSDNHAMAARLRHEASVTARLAHPGIVAVHDVGDAPDGRPWFTMEIVRGDTLERLIEKVHAASTSDRWHPTPDGWTFRRLIEAFHTACRAVAYAHVCGVVHRDLKPENVMVGAFGEVRVMDWGIARVLAEPEDTHVAQVAVPKRMGPDTAHGQVLGTVAYMAPEQARGEVAAIDARSDVYALGAMLYQLLSGERPYRGSGLSSWRELLRGPPEPVRQRNAHAHPPLPDVLVEICEHAMTREPDGRFRDAAAMADAVRDWLEGARRQEAALAIVERSDELLPRVRELSQRAEQLEERSAALLDGVAPHAPVEEKREGWALAREAAEIRRAARLTELERVQLLRTSLETWPDLAEAHSRLADLYKGRLERAEAVGDTDAIAELEVMLRTHDRGRYAAFVRGDAWVSLQSDPAGVDVEVYRYEEEDERLVPKRLDLELETPLRRLQLPKGSYLFVLKAPGRKTVRMPVLLGRAEHWRLMPPGARNPVPVQLPRQADVPEGCVVVPAGWFVSGGDPEAPDGLSVRRLWADAFIAMETPVTNAQWLEFLNDLVDQGREEEALRCQPADRDGVGGALRPIWPRDEQGRFALGAEAGGEKWAPSEPVVLIDWFAARAFAAWRTERDGISWRLPQDQEWEKMARGVDGRVFPWGNFFDATRCRMVQTAPDKVRWTAIDAHPDDRSPYGVRGVAGNVRDWCANPYTRNGLPDGARVSTEPLAHDSDYAMVRGGSWFSTPVMCRLSCRFVSAPGEHHRGIGFRLVATL